MHTSSRTMILLSLLFSATTLSTCTPNSIDLQNSAQHVLSLTHLRSVVTWTSLISGCVHNRRFITAFLHFSNMRRECVHPNYFTFPCVFKASSSLKMPVTGKQLHALALKAGQIYDVIVGCSAFNMYSKTGLRVEAWNMFDEMPHRNLTTCNAYISNAVQDGRPLDAIGAFKEFICVAGEPNRITFCAFLNACADMSNLELGHQLHAFIICSGYREDVSVLNGLVDFYGKCGDIVSSEMVFNRISRKNAVSWCSMLSTLVLNHKEEKACMVFLQARKEEVEPTDFMISSTLSACAELGGLELGKSIHALAVKACVEDNMFVVNALVDLYGKCGDIVSSEMVFNRISRKNVVSWCSMLSALVQNHKEEMACMVFLQARKEEVEPTDFMISSTLSACAELGGLELGKSVHALAVKACVEDNMFVRNALVDLYGKCGDIVSSEMVFNRISRKNVVSWCSMLSALMQNHKEEMACMVFLQARKEEVEPTDFIISSILSACAKLGGLELGKSVHALAVKACVEDNIFVGSTLVDLYGKCGLKIMLTSFVL